MGTATASHGLLSFPNVVFSSYGTHELIVASLDGQISNTLRVTVPLATQFVASALSPRSIVIDETFDLDILAADRSGQAMAAYTGLVKVVIASADAVLSTSSYWLDGDEQGHLILDNLALHELGTYTITVSDGIVSSVLSVEEVTLVASTIVGRQLFYNQSGIDGAVVMYDGNDPAINSLDDNAIATDKVAYLPGAGPATFANVSSYSKGINGIMVDIAGSHPSITAADFIFQVGNNNAPSTWAMADAPIAVSVRAGAAPAVRTGSRLCGPTMLSKKPGSR